MTRKPYLMTATTALSLALGACGGSGGGVNSMPPSAPTPTPSPTPTPTPTPSAALSVFPAVTTSTQFAVLGYEGPRHNATPASITGSGFAVRYDASSGLYVFDFPSSQPGSVDVYQTGDRYWNGTLAGQPAGSSAIPVDVFRPGPQNWDFQLTYTSFALYASGNSQGVVAFGLPTPDAAMPVTGSATYNAFVAATADVDYGIRGSAALQFNFGAGTLSGRFDPVIYDLLAGNTPLGHYDFVNTVYGTGSTTFSGKLSSPSVTALGAFDGQFTGPAAQELMAHFTAPFIDPYSATQKQMFGVWVGAKH